MEDKLERAGLVFDLQFFADGEAPAAEPAPETTAGTPALESSGSTTAEAEEEIDFIDPALVPKEVKEQDYFKGMKRAYTQKTQELAPFRKACEEVGLTPQQAAQILKETNQLVATARSLAQEKGGDAAIEYIAETLGISRKKAEKVAEASGVDMEADPFADDEYAQTLRKKIKEEAVKEAEERLAKKYEPLMQRYQAEELAKAQQFKAEVDKAIDKVMNDFKGLLPSNVTHEVLFKCAEANKVDPKMMEATLMLTLGPEKYNELIQNRILQRQKQTAKENKNSVGPTLSSAAGMTPQTAETVPDNFKAVAKDVWSMIQAKKNQT